MSSIRERNKELILRAASEEFADKGFAASKTSDIAAKAGVPKPNVYYYFKSKDALVSAVIDSYGTVYRAMISGIEQQTSPPERLKALLSQLIEQRDQLTAHGCPIGSLNSELGKRGDDVQAEAGDLLRALVDWSAAQFAAMGRPDARELGVALIAAYEGATLIAHALRDPAILQTEVERLTGWIDELA